MGYHQKISRNKIKVPSVPLLISFLEFLGRGLAQVVFPHVDTNNIINSSKKLFENVYSQSIRLTETNLQVKNKQYV